MRNDLIKRQQLSFLCHFMIPKMLLAPSEAICADNIRSLDLCSFLDVIFSYY